MKPRRLSRVARVRKSRTVVPVKSSWVVADSPEKAKPKMVKVTLVSVPGGPIPDELTLYVPDDGVVN